MERPRGIVPTPLRQRLEDLRGGPLSAAAFLLAAFALWWTVEGQPESRRYIALVRADEYVLRAPEGRVVRDVLVGVFDHVEAGQVLCTYESGWLEAELAVARVVTAELEAEVGAEAERLASEERRLAFDEQRAALVARTDEARAQRELRAMRRDLLIDRENFRLEALRHWVELATLDVDRRRYETRRDFLADLVEPGLVPAAEEAELRVRLAAMGDEAARLHGLVEAARAAEAAADERLAVAAATDLALGPSAEDAPLASVAIDTEAVLLPLRRRIEVQRTHVAELVRTAALLELRAPVAGTIERLAAHPGRLTVGGEELVSLVADAPASADLFVREPVAVRLGVGAALQLFEPTAPEVVLEGRVLAEAPRYVQFPQRIWADQRYPEHGLAYLVAIPAESLLPAGTRLVARVPR